MKTQTTETTQKKSSVNLGGLWLNDNGNLTGRLGMSRLVITKNKFKTEENQPDYVMLVSTPEKKEEDTGTTAKTLK